MSNVRLDSWKSIAAYFGRGVRTVQRWHIDYGMPVYHYGGDKGSVYAYSLDLDHWLQKGAGMVNIAPQNQHATGNSKNGLSDEPTMRADKMWVVRSENTLPSIAALYREAVGKDPENTSALIGLARSVIAQALLDTLNGGAAYPIAREALMNCEDQIEAKSTSALLKIFDEKQYQKAKIELDEVLRVAPEDIHALVGYAYINIADAKLSEAYRCAMKAWRANPLSATLSYLPCWIQYLNSNYDQALSMVEEIKASGAGGVVVSILQALIMSAYEMPGANALQISEMVAEYPRNITLNALLGYNLALCGETDKAKAILHTLWSERSKRNSGYQLALILIGLRRMKEAATCLNEAFKDGSVWSIGYKNDPLLRTLRGDIQFEAILQKIGTTSDQRAVDFNKELMEESFSGSATPLPRENPVTVGNSM